MKTTVSRNRLLAGSFFRPQMVRKIITDYKRDIQMTRLTRINFKPTISLDKLENTKLYSEELGIQLRKANDEELFKWFLASILLGAPIQESVAKRTYHSFEKFDLFTPKKILKAGWDYLVFTVMREGRYVRFDEKTSTQLLRNCKMLLEKYRGSLKRLILSSANTAEAESKLMEFYGIGPVRTNIFLRELRPFMKNCDPEPLPSVRQLARKAGIYLDKYKRRSITFIRIEAGLIRNRNI